VSQQSRAAPKQDTSSFKKYGCHFQVVSSSKKQLKYSDLIFQPVCGILPSSPT
jgi:hypothetical protein